MKGAKQPARRRATSLRPPQVGSRQASETSRTFARRRIAAGDGRSHAAALDAAAQHAALLEAQRELELSRDRYAELYDFAPVAYVTLDGRGLIQECNLTAAGLLGLARAQLLGTPLRLRVHREDHVALREFQRGLNAGGARRVTELRLQQTRDAALPVELVGTTVRREDLPPEHRVVLADLTERRRIEAALRTSEKLAASGRMAAGVAHEINNPLGAITNAFYLIKDAVPPNHRYFKNMALIDGELRRIQQIVAQMLNLYRPGAQKPAQFSLCLLLANTADLLAAKARQHKVMIHHTPAPVETFVFLPEGPVSQIVFNLLTNACEASPAGGRVSVSAAVEENSVRVRVRDEGPGVAEEARRHLFEPFNTTKTGPGGGLGLGLSVSRALVESMGGQLGYDCPSAGGTEFWFLLPKREGRSA